MRLVLISIVLAISGLTFALPGGATPVQGTAITINGTQYLETGSYTSVTRDSTGKIIATDSGYLPEGITNLGADTTGSTIATQRDTLNPDGSSDFGAQAAGGSRDFTARDEFKDKTGWTVMWSYNVASHWEWGPSLSIFNMHTGISWDKGDSSWGHYENCIGQDTQSCYGWFYTWRGLSKGGHYSSRQGHIQQQVCLPFIGCWVDADCAPRVETWVTGGGGVTVNKHTNCTG